ncbi:MAG: hypothetical protein JXA77_05250 [Bacteroidales bacterium]|nr:hypothetical protein [Bacteroidales bacterium]MBN2820455.1 hypothetical protein [Bacteroidales bacterium]
MKKQLFITFLIYILYVGIILLANIFMEMSLTQNKETFEMLSGISFGFIGIPIFSLIIPIWLSKKWKLDFSFWPKKKNIYLVLSILFIFTFIVNFESIKTLIQSGLKFDIFIIHFIGILLFHTTYYALFVLLIFPVLRKNIDTRLSIIITALLFSLYHLAQFHFYPAGLTINVQIFLFCYFIASLLLYLWCESLILVAIVHQISGAIAVAANGSIHSEMDFLFFLTIPIITIFFGYMIYQSIKAKDKVNYNEKWWIKID